MNQLSERASLERVVLHQYSAEKRVWSKRTARIAVEAQPFAQGALRYAHKAQLFNKSQAPSVVVCKFAKATNTPKSLYFHDVEAQTYAQLWADKYNAAGPPKQIVFVDCFVVEFVDRPGRPLCGCETFVEGVFRKHNNNVGAVCASANADQSAQLDQHTAQAFSHFTYDRSNHHILICDIQGFEGKYTDPQIHTLSGKQFGSGNLGTTGIRAFMLRHTCNPVCKDVRLEPIVVKDLSQRINDAVEDEKNLTKSTSRLRRSRSRHGSVSGPGSQQPNHHPHPHPHSARRDRPSPNTVPGESLNFMTSKYHNRETAYSQPVTPQYSLPVVSPTGSSGMYHRDHSSTEEPVHERFVALKLRPNEARSLPRPQPSISPRRSQPNPRQPDKATTLNASDESLMAAILADVS